MDAADVVQARRSQTATTLALFPVLGVVFLFREVFGGGGDLEGLRRLQQGELLGGVLRAFRDLLQMRDRLLAAKGDHCPQGSLADLGFGIPQLGQDGFQGRIIVVPA